ncbi:uncharacterized protein Bfra_005431 [Botrytis fragariae]|uniref:Uncharacterized protein n=1 Tax=Botrytis fragariae TaxID=1964551 RepID=A0A8H6AUZ1_9HELO|nr:uncharacterized protein Bfra_005431 [Botrytis fragariae]KAF5873964.1 hypothetical protein Bfra_005431 [Botrytis fragariae]
MSTLQIGSCLTGRSMIFVTRILKASTVSRVPNTDRVNTSEDLSWMYSLRATVFRCFHHTEHTYDKEMDKSFDQNFAEYMGIYNCLAQDWLGKDRDSDLGRVRRLGNLEIESGWTEKKQSKRRTDVLGSVSVPIMASLVDFSREILGGKYRSCRCIPGGCMKIYSLRLHRPLQIPYLSPHLLRGLLVRDQRASWKFVALEDAEEDC